MSENIRRSKQETPADDPLPPIGAQVLVQAEGFRCLAFRDKDGKWRDVFRQQELSGTIRVVKYD